MPMTATWDKKCKPEMSLSLYKDLALGHCLEAGSPADALRLLIERDDYAGICSFELNYGHDLQVMPAYHMRQALGFYTKLEELDIGIDKQAVAMKKFEEFEGKCCITNRLFNMTASGDFHFPLDVQRAFAIAERKIRDVLGEVPSLNQLDLLFGPGATTSVTKRNASAREKLSTVASVSTNMLPLLPSLLRELPHYLGHYVENHGEGPQLAVDVDVGKLSFVPKNASSLRSVMTEPTLNALVQSGFGKVISERLRRVGQDTRDQTRNQKLAKRGSQLRELATLDLSSASDSISYELVAALLPYEWFAALALCRTPTVVYPDGRLVQLHKFSSMGNGFTFPLQTLIFWALASACREMVRPLDRRVSVYGDDIIIGVEAVPLFRKVLHCAGFTLNMNKSYWEGPFRESCGTDYLYGFNIRPFYARGWVTGETLFLLHNHYVRDCDPIRAKRVLSEIDNSLRIFGPDGYGDGHLLSSDARHLKPSNRRQGYTGYTFQTYTRKSRRSFKNTAADYVYPLYSAYEREFALDDEEKSPTPHIALDKEKDDWLWAVSLPGAAGYKRIKIYVLS